MIKEILANFQNGLISAKDAIELMKQSQNASKTQLLSEGQKGLWAIQKIAPESTNYNVPLCLRVSSHLNAEALRKACEFLLRQYPMLNSTIVVDGGVLQRTERPSVAPLFEQIQVASLSEEQAISQARAKSKQPFSMEDGPFVRFHLFTRSATDHYFLIVVHHIVFDGSSIEPLMAALLEAYDMLVSGRVPSVRQLAASYGDFVERERAILSGEDGKKLRKYWLERLSGNLPVMELPSDRPRALSKSKRSAMLKVQVPESLSEKIKTLAKAHRTNLSVVFLAVYKILLHRYTSQEDIIVGMPVDGRQEARFDPVVGYFVSMIALRSQVKGATNFLDFMQSVQLTLLDGIDHASYPFPVLVRELQASASSGTHPIYQTSFVYQNFNGMKRSGSEIRTKSGLRFDLVDQLSQESTQDFELEVLEMNAGFALNAKYGEAFFDEKTIVRMMQHYMVLLENIANNPLLKINDYSLMPPQELEQILSTWNATDLKYSHDICLHEMFRKQAEKTPEAIAVVFKNSALTYRELDEMSNGLAHKLQRMGVGRGSTVGICVQRSFDLVAGLLGILKAGAAYVPLDPHYPKDRLAYMIADSHMSLVLSQSGLMDGVFSLLQEELQVLLLDKELDVIDQTSGLISRTESTDLAYVMYTSGSTGKPKGVMIPHRALINFLESMKRKPGIDADDRLLAVTTYSFDIAGLELFLPLINGAQCHICDTDTARDARRLKQEIERIKPTIMQATPTTWSMLFQIGWRNTEQVRILCGGEMLPGKLAQQFIDSDSEVWNMYGPTETTIWSTIERVDAGTGGSIGKPISNTQIYILDGQMKPAPILVPGELCIAGDGLAHGYLNQAALTAEKFVDNPYTPGTKLYKTGDLARWLPNGKIDYLGRIDSQVKLNGFRIELGEIETRLQAHEGIAQCAVVVAESSGGKQLVAYYVKKGLRRSDEDVLDYRDLRTHLKKSLPEHMVPARFIEVDRIALTPNGKIDRKKLAAEAAATTQVADTFDRDKRTESPKPAPDADSISPDIGLEERILAVWRNLLGIQDIGPEDGFFDVGGNSINAIIAAEKIAAEFGVDFDVTSLFKHACARNIGHYLKTEIKSKAIDAVESVRKDADTFNVLREKKAVPEPSGVSHVHAEQLEKCVAIIGISCQFPGAETHREFWTNLRDGKESIEFLSRESLLEMGVDTDIVDHPNHVAAYSTIDGKDLFDPGFFKISHRDAELLDPQARLLLMHAWKAVEDSGYTTDKIRETGVFVSASNNFYLPLGFSSSEKEGVDKETDAYHAWILAQSGTIPTLISYKLGLTGESIFINTNCSSSLTALHSAYRSLILGDSKCALVGASTILPGKLPGYIYQPGMNFSKDGHVRAFDAAASGMVGGEGVAVILLKRASEAIRDGDHIYALLRGIALNNDGTEKAGFYAPSPQGQAKVIEKVLKSTGVEPESIQYIEAHGTGTSIGDPIEFSALQDAYRKYTQASRFCGIGSVKTNIGHLDTAAGLAGCIKVALSLSNKEIPPTLHYKEPNPRLQLEGSPFYIAHQRKPWLESNAPRRAALSSFGIGGTNAHAIFEEAPAAPSSNQNRNDRAHIVPLSARKKDRLLQYAGDLRDYLRGQDKADLCDIAHTLQIGREAMACRVAFIVRNTDELIAALDRYVNHLEHVGNRREGEVDAPITDGLDEAELKDLAEKWIAGHQWEKIAASWIRGWPIEWEKLYGKGEAKRVSLPTYPFARERYWLRRKANDATVRGLSTLNEESQGPQAAASFDRSALKEVSVNDLGNSYQLDRPTSSPYLSEFSSVMAQVLLEQLRQFGLTDHGTLPELQSKLGGPAYLSRWAEASLRHLASNGLLDFDSNAYRIRKDALLGESSGWQKWHQKKSTWLSDESLAALVALAEPALQALPKVLQGRVRATDVIFPGSSMELVEKIYKFNQVGAYFNQILAEAVEKCVSDRLKIDPSAKIRILEVGAGTGSSSVKILKKLESHRGRIAEYCYSDVSKAFLLHAEENYGVNYPYLTYRVFDVEKPGAPQKISDHSYDIVVATNVLHATKNIRTTLKHVKAAMRPGGFIFLNEITENNLFSHITFGLLDGWWRFEDAPLRIHGSPILALESWKEALNGLGFGSIFMPALRSLDLGQQIIVAKSGSIAQNNNAIARNEADGGILRHREVDGSRRVESGGLNDNLLRKAGSDFIKDAVANTLRMSPDDIEASEALTGYGLDSILIVRLTKVLKSVFSSIDSTMLFEYSTIDALLGYLIRTERPALAQLAGNDGIEQYPSPESSMENSGAQEEFFEPAPCRPLDAGAASGGVVPQDRCVRDVAIIGVAGRYANANNLDELWEILQSGETGVVEIPKDRWDWKQYFSKDKGKPGTMYSKWGAFMRDIDKFDAAFFNISKEEADWMDPQERIFLETAYACIEDAGYTPANLATSRKVGVFVGVTNGFYSLGPQYFSIPSRVSYFCDFKGPSMAIDSACSASLTALHYALESLYAGTIECALVGGVNLIIAPTQYIELSAAKMLSEGSQCRSFGEGADGFVDGEGVGAFVLKPLQKAIDDGDQIYGVIKGSMINSSGRTSRWSVPNPGAQAEVIQEALERAGVDARTISYVEAHGTGTPLGDPIEVAGLARAFRHYTQDTQFCVIGTGKPNIGYCESASGIAGITKVLLQFKHKRYVPSLYSENLNPEIDFDSSPFMVNRTLTDWHRPILHVDGVAREFPRRAGVSSFGATGSNAHVILEEYESGKSAGSLSGERVLIVLSAKNQERLHVYAKQFFDTLKSKPFTDRDLLNIAYTLQVGRVEMSARLAVIVSSIEELQQALKNFLDGRYDMDNFYFSGAVVDESALPSYAEDEEFQETLEKWLQRAKYEKLADLWVRGVGLNWRVLYCDGGRSNPRRMSLPTYPFAKERHWVSVTKKKAVEKNTLSSALE